MSHSLEIFTEVEISFKNHPNARVIHNLPLEGPNNIVDAITSWQIRTKKFTGRDFCDYINSKGIYTAYTYEEYERALEEERKQQK